MKKYLVCLFLIGAAAVAQDRYALERVTFGTTNYVGRVMLVTGKAAPSISNNIWRVFRYTTDTNGFKSLQWAYESISGNEVEAVKWSDVLSQTNTIYYK